MFFADARVKRHPNHGFRGGERLGDGEGMTAEDFAKVVLSLVEDKKATPETVRQRKKRLADKLVAGRVVEVRDGVYYLAE